MKTSIINIDVNDRQELKVRQVADTLTRGGIVAFPTETVFGLACDLANTEAIKRLYEIKNRPQDKPFTIQVASTDRVLDIVGKQEPLIENIMRRFWPGPLTMIIDGEDQKKGFRVPDNKVALAILSAIDSPLAVTSANLSGESALTSIEDVTKSFNGLIDVIIDDSGKSGGIESTVLDCTIKPFKILRKGAISEALEQYIQSQYE